MVYFIRHHALHEIDDFMLLREGTVLILLWLSFHSGMQWREVAYLTL
jgi:hypothetical protein